MKKNSVSIIIPNYNGEKLLRKNLPLVMKAVKERNPQIIVVDDVSTDGSISFIKNKFPKVLVVEGQKSRGFSSAVNQGVKRANGEIIVLLNHDIEPKVGFLTPLLAHFEKDEVFAVGCLQESIEGGKTVLRGRGIGSFRKGLLLHARGEVDHSNTLWVSGGAGAFRRTLWEKLGGLDELYNPFYWEDIDLSYRALKAGYRIVFEPTSVVVHRQEKGAIRVNYSSLSIKKIAYRNQFIFHWKNLTDKKLIISHLLWLPHHFISALMRFDWAFFSGFFAAIGKLSRILKERRSVRKLNKKRDKEVVGSFEKVN